MADLADWLLAPAERGNPATRLDRRRPGGVTWSTGNRVRPLVHGSVYFAELLAAVRAQQAGDLLLFTDWRGDPDEPLDGPGTEIGRVLCEAAERGVIVKGLVWRRPERDAAFVGGIDLCHSLRDDTTHQGDPLSQPFAAVYGPRPPWHDIQLAIHGPAVGDVEATFSERWEDPAPLSRSPLLRLRELMDREDTSADPMPPQLPDSELCATQTVQLLRTYPARIRGYDLWSTHGPGHPALPTPRRPRRPPPVQAPRQLLLSGARCGPPSTTLSRSPRRECATAGGRGVSRPGGFRRPGSGGRPPRL
jgi:phosphatidylserine/phosphatidylglycerophosphate/cardiolipin synthase-like enzyme